MKRLAFGIIAFLLAVPSPAKSPSESKLRCTYAGAFIGTFTGDDSGKFGLLVDAKSGFVTGFAWSKGDDEALVFGGATPILPEQKAAFVIGGAEEGVGFSGGFTSPDRVSGTWMNYAEALSGTFEGRRIGGSRGAWHRFTGMYLGNDEDAHGLFSVDVNFWGAITMTVYDIARDELEVAKGMTLTNGNMLTGRAGGRQFAGILDRSAGTFNGVWTDDKGASGTFSSNSCALK